MTSLARRIRDYLPGLLVLAGGLYTVYYYYMYWIRVYGALCIPGFGDPVKVEVTQGIWIRLDAILFPTVFGVILALLGIMIVWKKKFGAAVVALVLGATVINWPGFLLIAGGSLLGILIWRKTLLPVIDLPMETMEWVDEAAGITVLKSYKALPSKRLVYSFKSEDGMRYVVKETVSEELSEREFQALQTAVKKGLPVPKAVGTDGAYVLMKQIDGVPFLQPLDFELWADELAETLAAVHRSGPSGIQTGQSLSRPIVPAWAFDSDIWELAAQVDSEESKKSRITFLHGDYEPANVLFHEGHVSGVTGWTCAGDGPAQLDVSRMRVALVLIHGEEVADRFLRTYKTKTDDPSFHYDRYWDLQAVYHWLVQEPADLAAHWARFGVTTLSGEEVMRRLELFVKSLVEEGR